MEGTSKQDSKGEKKSGERKKGERKKDVKPRELHQLRHDQRIMLAYTNIKKDVYEHITYLICLYITV